MKLGLSSLCHLSEGELQMYVCHTVIFIQTKQPYNLSEILLDTLAMPNGKHKMEKMQINLKIELFKIYYFLIFPFFPMLLTTIKC